MVITQIVLHTIFPDIKIVHVIVLKQDPCEIEPATCVDAAFFINLLAKLLKN